jgi:hypothetical protein
VATPLFFLDPRYSIDVREEGVYRYAGGPDLSRQVREWAVGYGENPRLRIAFCGLADEYKMPRSWSALPWSNAGGATKTPPTIMPGASA